MLERHPSKTNADSITQPKPKSPDFVFEVPCSLREYLIKVAESEATPRNPMITDLKEPHDSNFLLTMTIELAEKFLTLLIRSPNLRDIYYLAFTGKTKTNHSTQLQEKQFPQPKHPSTIQPRYYPKKHHASPSNH